MKYLYLIFLNLIVFQSFAQIQKVYVTKEGAFSSDPKKSNSYITIQKLEGYSAYSVKQYDMHDTIIMTGTYKDKLLEVPNGKFIYYEKKHGTIEKMQSENYYMVDTNNYIQTVGFFSNGMRVGTWIEYAAKDVKQAEYNYENGKLEGLYKKYYNNYAGNWSIGTMVDDALEGKVSMYNRDSLLVSETEYVNNKIVNTIVHWKEAKSPDNFHEYLERQLKKYQKQIHDAPPVFVKFTVNKMGKVLNVQVIKGVSPEVDKALITAFINVKLYYPATYDGVPIEQVTFIPLILFREKEAEAAVKLTNQN